MKPIQRTRQGIALATTLASIALVAGCASQPNVRSDYDHSANFSGYRTYGFPSELGTDRTGYSTLITGYFKNAVSQEMNSRGYTYTENNPDLIVNFSANARDQTDVQSIPDAGVGYYGYRYGIYGAWPGYGGQSIDTIHYKVGTANIDVVDAAQKKLIWEGVAEGTLTDDAMKNPQPAITNVVNRMFADYPVPSPTAAAK